MTADEKALRDLVARVWRMAAACGSDAETLALIRDGKHATVEGMIAALSPPATDGGAKATRMFPIHSEDRRKLKTPPYEIDWAFVAPHEEQAKANHDQTLERLAERGGCGWNELLAIVRDQHWRAFSRMPMIEARDAVLADFETWRSASERAAATGPLSPGFGDRLTEVVRGACERAAAQACATCGHDARHHAVDDEERRECELLDGAQVCACQQYVAAGKAQACAFCDAPLDLCSCGGMAP